VLCWDDRPLLKLLEELERKLRAQGAAEGLLDGRDMVVSRLILPGCAYVVSRVATAIVESLSPRQRQVAELVIVKRMSRKEAARQLGLSLGTLRTHLERIYKKIGSPDALARQLTLLS
jgi:DNA-binding NarL/FixJ family response regulator